MAKKKRVGLWVTLGIVSFILILLIGALIFTFVSVKNLNSEIIQKKADVIAAYEARQEHTAKLMNALEKKMSLDPKPFKDLKNAEAELKKATTVKEFSDVNIKVDTAIDFLVFKLRDKYLYLEDNTIMSIQEDIDSARSRIVMESTDYNTVAKDYNFAIENFPGSLAADVLKYEKVDTFQIVDYEDLTYAY